MIDYTLTVTMQKLTKTKGLILYLQGKHLMVVCKCISYLHMQTLTSENKPEQACVSGPLGPSKLKTKTRMKTLTEAHLTVCFAGGKDLKYFISV